VAANRVTVAQARIARKGEDETISDHIGRRSAWQVDRLYLIREKLRALQETLCRESVTLAKS
jgi:hypothetical protein